MAKYRVKGLIHIGRPGRVLHGIAQPDGCVALLGLSDHFRRKVHGFQAAHATRTPPGSHAGAAGQHQHIHIAESFPIKYCSIVF
jgi:hypothetical protein